MPEPNNDELFFADDNGNNDNKDSNQPNPSDDYTTNLASFAGASTTPTPDASSLDPFHALANLFGGTSTPTPPPQSTPPANDFSANLAFFAGASPSPESGASSASLDPFHALNQSGAGGSDFTPTLGNSPSSYGTEAAGAMGTSFTAGTGTGYPPNNPNPYQPPNNPAGIYAGGQFIPQDDIQSVRTIERPKDDTSFSFAFSKPKEPVVDYDDIVENKTEMQELSEKLFSGDIKRERIQDDYEREVVQKRLKLITDKVKKDIEILRKKERRTGSSAGGFKILTTLLAAIVTVLLGLNISGILEEPLWYYKTRQLVEREVIKKDGSVIIEQQMKTSIKEGLRLSWFINTAALFITAFLTLLSDLQSFYDSKEFWLKYTDTANRLEMLLENIEYLEIGGDYITTEDVTTIKIAYDKIKESLHNYIVKIRSDEDDKLMQAVLGGDAFEAAQKRNVRA